jgi:hypothetical protein
MLEQSNYWKIFGISEKGFNGPAHLTIVVQCCFEPAEQQVPECRASVHRPDYVHMPRLRIVTVADPRHYSASVTHMLTALPACLI